MRTTARTAGRAALLGVLLALPACGAPDTPPGDGPAATTTEPTMTTSGDASTPTEAPPGGHPTGGTADEDPAQAAARDLAEHLSVPVGEVAVVRSVAVTWRDGALGCPRPGMAYTQALTPGRLIELEVDGRTYSYHSGPERGPFRCERPEEPYETHA